MTAMDSYYSTWNESEAKLRARLRIRKDHICQSIRKDIHAQIASQCPQLTGAFLSRRFEAPSVFVKQFVGEPKQFKFTKFSDDIRIYLSLVSNAIVLNIGWTYDDVIKVSPEQTIKNVENAPKIIVASACDPFVKNVFSWEFDKCDFDLDEVFVRLSYFIACEYFNFIEAYASIIVIADNEADIERQLLKQFGLNSIKNKIERKTIEELDQIAFDKYRSILPEYIPTEN